MKRILRSILIGMAVYGVIFLLLFFSEEVTSGVQKGVSVCLSLMILSTFLFLVLTDILSKSRAGALLARPFFFLSKLFRIRQRDADVVVTVTNAIADLVVWKWLKKGSLVMTMVSFRETEPAVVLNADRRATDHVGQSLHRGNVMELAHAGKITESSFEIVVQDVLAGKMPARTDPNDIIYAQIIGTGMLDVAVAGLLLQEIARSGEEIRTFDMTR